MGMVTLPMRWDHLSALLLLVLLVGGGLVGVFIAICLPLAQCLSGMLAPGIPIVRPSEFKYDVHSLYGWVDGAQHSTWETLKERFS